MEAIFASAFGRAIDIQRNKSDKLKEATSAIFSSVRGNKKDSMARATMILSTSCTRKSQMPLLMLPIELWVKVEFFYFIKKGHAGSSRELQLSLIFLSRMILLVQ